MKLQAEPEGVNFDEPDHPMEYFWRYESSCRFISRDDAIPHIYPEKYMLVKHTPQGVWVAPYIFRKYSKVPKSAMKLVLHHTNKAHAYPTKALAWHSFLIRQDRRILHCRIALQRAQAIRDLAIKQKAPQ